MEQSSTLTSRHPAPRYEPPPARPARRAGAGEYRPDVDGLRAVAVLSVLFYHLGFGAFAGGYVGVDVFFVISGFLITRLIRGQIEAGTFTFRGFYLRRVRRLLPALLATSAVTAAIGAALLSPERLQELAGSIVYASFSLSNWFFFRHSDYFAASAFSRPMLHTWSLSVEEQFYLVWPALLLLLLAAGRRRWAPLAIAAIGVASLAVTAYFGGHASAVFYLTPFRAFEFAIGALVVWTTERLRAPNWALELLLWAGLGLIVVSVIGVGTQTFSDVALLTPCVGTAMVLYAGTARVSGMVLRNRLAVGIGLISYSMYLVHWPLIVFLRYWRFDEPAPGDRWIVVAGTFAAAVALYFGVEKRFRIRTRDVRVRSNARFLIGYAAGLALVVGVSAHMAMHGGWLWRYPPTVQRQIRADTIAADEAYTWRAFYRAARPFPADARRKILLIGDSQGADVVNMLAESGALANVDLRTVEVDMECQALIAFTPAPYAALDRADRASCARAYAMLGDTTTFRGADEVILALNWDRRGTPYIAQAVARLHQLGVRKVYVVGRKSQGASGVDLVLHYGLGPATERESARRKNAIAWAADARITALHGDFVYVDLMSQICPSADRCAVLTDSRDIIFFDGSHFTPAGARFVGARLARTGVFDFEPVPPPAPRRGAGVRRA